MKKIMQKIAELMVLVLLLSVIPMNIMPVSAEGEEGVATSFAAGTVLETAPEISEMGLAVGQGLIDTYLAADDIIACRDDEGWTQDASAWSWGLPKSGWSWWKESTAVTEAEVTAVETLSLTAYQTDGVILLPTLPSANYKFEATFTVVGTQAEGEENVTTPSGSFGLVTNINPTYADSIGGTRFGAYTTGHSSGDKNRVFVHNKAKKASIGEELYESKQTNTDNLSGYTAPSAGDSVTMTVYVYGGTNYYYINGIYVTRFASKLTTEGESLCGVYCSGNDALTVTITDICVKELITAPVTPNEISALNLAVGDALIDTDMYVGTAIPSRDADGWTQVASEWSYGRPKGKDDAGNYTWGWWRGNAANTSAAVSADHAISTTAYETDNVILLPKLPSTNYKFEATFKIENAIDPNASFGLVTNIAPSYAESLGGSLFAVYAKGHSNTGKLYAWNRMSTNTEGYVKRTNVKGNTLIPDYTAPGAGDSITLTVYSYDGTNYYFINGEYATSLEVSEVFTASGESLCGIYLSGNTNDSGEALQLTITDISVRQLLVVEDNTEDNTDETEESTGDSTDETEESTGDSTDETEESTGDSTGSTEESTEDDDDTSMEEEVTGLEFDGYYTMGEVLYQSDFENETIGELPEGWSKGSRADGTSYGWTDTKVNAYMTGEVTALEGYGNVVHFGSYFTDAYINLPATGTMDYLFEATVIVNYDTEGEFGLANNFYASVMEADGCMYNSSHIPAAGAEKKASTWKYRKSNGSTKGEWAVSYYPKKGDTANLKILSYNGYNYMYWNDILCAIAQARGVTDGGTAVSDNPGFFTYNGDIYITEAKVTKIYYDRAELAIDKATLCIDEAGKVGVDVALSFDKTQEIYSKYVSGDYAYSDNADMKFGVLMAVGNGQTAQEIAADTDGVVNTVFTEFTQDDGAINFVYSISDIPEENYDKFYTVQPYVLVQDAYYYGNAKAYSAAALANGIYSFVEDDAIKETLEDVFADSKVFVGKDGASLTFTLFSDFHYKAKMYPTTIADLKSILDRADTSNSAFVMSAGDFCNDALGSPELFNTYHNYYTQEGELLKAYNIYGNHELESKNNSMEVVTALLTNDDSVVWGTADGTYDSSVGYYYFESNGFRIVCTDNNYSWNPTGEYWEHNRTKSYGAPKGNTNTYSLGPEQLAWLESVLTDAADQDIPCVIVEHSTSADVSAIYRKVNDINPGTVLMCISGHTHTDEQELDDGVFHLVCNTTRNGEWIDGGEAHYTSEHTFMYEDYDSEGNLLSTYEMSLASLSQGDNTWFFTDPLSAVITINEYGVIVVDGYESSWAYDIVPATAGGNCVPRISSGTYWACDMLGHNMAYETDETYHWSDGCANALCYETVEKTAHTYGEWSTVKEATTDETGLKQRACMTCGHTESEVIPVISGSTEESTGAGDAGETEDESESPEESTGAGDAGETEDESESPEESTGAGDAGETEGESESPEESTETGDAGETEGESESPEESTEAGNAGETEDEPKAPGSNDAAGDKTDNSSVKPGDQPDTGDRSGLFLWILLACASMLLVTLLVCRKKWLELR